jgi:protein-disulfide isomerase
MIYYTDYRCAECRVFANTKLPELRRRFVDSGRLRIVIRELAGTPESVLGAVAARCAGEFGKHWVFHDSLFAASDSRLTMNVVYRIAARSGLPSDPFARCMAANRYAMAVRAEAEKGKSLSIIHLPTIVIGNASGKTAPGTLVRGDAALSWLDVQIESALRL